MFTPALRTPVTPQNVITAAICDTNAQYNNINAKCNKLSTRNVKTFLTQNVITQFVITPDSDFSEPKL